MERNVNEFEMVGRLVANNLIRGGDYRYVVYAQDKRIEFFAGFDLPEGIEVMDYIYVRGYINGRIRRDEDTGEDYQTQRLRATIIEKADTELERRFGVPGSVGDTYLNIYLSGTIRETVFENDDYLRFTMSIPAAPEMESKRDRIVQVNASKRRIPDLAIEPGDEIYIYATISLSEYENEDGKTRSRQRVTMLDHHIN